MAEALARGIALLNEAYDALDLRGEHLVDVREGPSRPAAGDWLTLAARVGAERVFFVDDDPVIVFSALASDASEHQVLEAYRRTWCLARPRCLFLAVGDELRVYALSQLPERGRADKLKALEVVTRAANVAEALDDFRRDRLETGAAFEGPAFQRSKSRADERLLQDVRAAEAALMNAGLTRRGAHALIERAILVRYLEDRDVLTKAYFEKLAAGRPDWRTILAGFQQPQVGAASRFVVCLQDRDLTAALFERLAEDFNGDLFVDRDGEIEAISDKQLTVLRALLSGAHVDGRQGQLFLWAYDFSIVPTSLISSMYELFYRREAEGATSTYYTPRSLVELVLTSVLTDEVLDGSPVVCDPACGSGVFLVAAFRRMAQFEAARYQGRLSGKQLQRLLLERVRGVDIDEAAVRLAAFSLYLAYLDMQQPPDILKAGRLPPLIAKGVEDDALPLHVADAFDDGVLDDGVFDVVVANPPWTEPKAGPLMERAHEWAKQRGLPFGDKNPSQLFLWRALKLLREEGQAALLIGAGALLNARSTSVLFRQRFLRDARVEQVMALWPVRGDFFAGAKAPFAFIRFSLPGEDGDPDPVVVFDTAKRGGPRDGSLTYMPVKRRLVRASQLAEHDFLWKTMSQGSRRDGEFVLRMRQERTKLGDLIEDDHPPRFGWQRAHRPGTGAEPDAELQAMPSIKKLLAWGPMQPEWLVPLPPRVTRVPHGAAFDGRRLLVDMGITADEYLHARIVTDKLAFDHNIWALPLQHRPDWEADVALGVLLSSMGRYLLSMTGGHWGVWRDQMRKEQLVQLPLRLPSAEDERVVQICEAVAELPDASATASLFEQHVGSADALLERIDDAVFDLFDLADFERDLVRDHWRERAAQRDPGPGLSEQTNEQAAEVLTRYANAFSASWRPLLGESLDLSWVVLRDRPTRTLAVVFGLHEVGEQAARPEPNVSWSEALGRLAGRGDDIAGGLRAFGMVRGVTDDEIVLVKRDRPELWTATAAREDAEAASVQLTVAHGA